MFYFIHAIAGMLVGGYFNSITIAIILGIVGHFLLDLIPHWDGFYDKEAFEKRRHLKITKNLVMLQIVDAALTILSIIYILKNVHYNKTIMLIGAFAGLLPDLIKAGYLTPLRNNKYFDSYLHFHSTIQKEPGWKIGILIELAVLAIILWAFKII